MTAPTAFEGAVKPVRRRPDKGGRGMAAAVASARDLARLHPSRWLLGFVGVELGCQLMLLSSVFAKGRVFIRTAAFTSSLALLMRLRPTGARHPASWAAIAVCAIIGVSIFNPDTNGPVAGIATVCLYLSIFAPVFWVPRIRIDATTVRRLFLILWVFNTASALVGLLQVYFPGRFDPSPASILQDNYIEALKFSLADGTLTARPMGLTDCPGGAANGGYYCVLLGVGFLLDRPRPWFRFVLLASMAASLVTIYLCQVRALLVMLAVSLLALAIPLAAQRRIGRFVSTLAIIVCVAVVGFVLAVVIGGDAVSDRFVTLFDSDPQSVYYANRGRFLETTLYGLLPTYPLGAGLGRFGMISSYFTDGIQASPPIWVEIQWTAWLCNGGVLLMAVYAAALLVALRSSLRIAAQASRAGASATNDLKKWATVLFGYSVGVIALTFTGCPFEGTMGLDFWLINSTLFAASWQAASIGA
jgi:hypothetical protein